MLLTFKLISTFKNFLKYPQNFGFLDSIGIFFSKMSNRLRSRERNTTTYTNEAFVSTEPSTSQSFMYIDYNLSPDETLHTISMKFGVNIVDLKRINSLQNDRDVYALKIIKIPIKPNSIHSEHFADQIKYGSSQMNRLNSNALLNADPVEPSKTPSLDSEDDKSTEEFNSPIGYDQNGEILAQSNFIEIRNEDEYEATTALLQESNELISKQIVKPNKQTKEAKRFLKKLDNNLESLKSLNNELITAVKSTHEPDIEQLVPVSNASYSIETRSGKPGAKSGLFQCSVRDVLIIACIVVILLPLVIFFYRFLYIKEHQKP